MKLDSSIADPPRPNLNAPESEWTVWAVVRIVDHYRVPNTAIHMVLCEDHKYGMW